MLAQFAHCKHSAGDSTALCNPLNILSNSLKLTAAPGFPTIRPKKNDRNRWPKSNAAAESAMRATPLCTAAANAGCTAAIVASGYCHSMISPCVRLRLPSTAAGRPTASTAAA